MICCASLAMAGGLVAALGRRLALVVLVGGGTLVDPAPLLAHASMICGG
ncbi:MAG: hypothetical protein JF588_21385 [Caulobacterales bacterium]|nr:hypothetical protein [Caulobacterales bacterium]